MYISDLTFSGEKLLVKGEKGIDPDGMDIEGIGNPRWSYNDKKILYIKFL